MSEKEFMEMIKKKRLDSFMTQKELAKKLYISQSKYCKLEAHQQALSYALLQGLGTIFQIDLNIIKTMPLTTHLNYD